MRTCSRAAFTLLSVMVALVMLVVGILGLARTLAVTTTDGTDAITTNDFDQVVGARVRARLMGDHVDHDVNGGKSWGVGAGDWIPFLAGTHYIARSLRGGRVGSPGVAGPRGEA